MLRLLVLPALAVVVLSLSAHQAQAQGERLLIGPRIGANITDFRGLPLVNPTGGVNGGFFIGFKVKEWFMPTLEVLYTMKGYSQPRNIGPKVQGIHYMEFPVLFQFMVPTGTMWWPKAFVGVAPAVPVYVPGEIYGTPKYDVGLPFGIGFDVRPFEFRPFWFTFDIRYTLGVVDQDPAVSKYGGDKMYNSCTSFNLGFAYGLGR